MKDPIRLAALALASSAALALAAPASAQSYGGGWGPAYGGPAYGAPGYGYGAPMYQRAADLYREIDRAYAARAMGASKARDYRRGVERLLRLEREYARDGLDRRDQDRLEQRYLDLRSGIGRYTDRIDRRW